MPRAKDFFFFGLFGISAVGTLYQLYKMPAIVRDLKRDYPECTKSNENFWQVFFGSILFIALVQYPMTYVS